MVESTKSSTPDVTLPKTESKKPATHVEAELSPLAVTVASGALQEAEKKAAEEVEQRARARRVSERMGEEEAKQNEAKKKIEDGLKKKQYDTTPNTIIAPSHEGKRPEEIVVTNKVTATYKEVEESKKNREVEWNSSPFNPKNQKTFVKVS